MKLLTGWVISAGLVLSAAAANAQILAPYQIQRPPYMAVSDVEGPYAAMPGEIPAPRYGPTYYGSGLLPPAEVFAILRESGFSPLGVPHQRGPFYTIAVIDRGGDDGRLVIDGRTGRIVRFMPAYRMHDHFHDHFNDEVVTYGPAGPLPPITYGPGGPGSLPPISDLRGPPRPPAAVPRVASRTPSVPVPKASPRSAEVRPEVRPPAASPAPAPAQQSAEVQTRPSEAPTAPRAAPSAPATLEAKPVPQIQPTQPMPKAQGLD